MSTDPSPTSRETQRLAWARQALGDPSLRLESASSDAGFRSYWRVCAGGHSRVLMDSPPALEDVRPWLRMHALLHTGGVRVPALLATDVDAGFLLLEDLGAHTYLQLLDEANADELFDRAIDQLLTLQRIAPPADLPVYDCALLERELRLFDQWFLGRHLEVELDGGERDALHRCYDRLIDAALAQPQVLVHRDFMPRNLMPAGAQAAVLDFQDAVRGPLAYDALSLFKDAFRGWPRERVDRWLLHYRRRALDADLPLPDEQRFARDADWIGLQRHLKVLGIFARLRHRDHKPKYVADAPRFVAYLTDVLPRYPELAPLAALLQRHVLPALDGRG